MLHKNPGNSSIRELGSAARRVRRGGGGTEQGSRRWRAEERFFGKSANPITGSGAGLVSLAALKSHFNWLFLSAPFCCSFLLFSSISTHHGPHSACFFSPFVCFTRSHNRGRAVYVDHQQNTLSPCSCVMSKCVRCPQHHSPCASHNCAGAYQASAEQQQPTLIRSAHPSVLPETPAGTNG